MQNKLKKDFKGHLGGSPLGSWSQGCGVKSRLGLNTQWGVCLRFSLSLCPSPAHVLSKVHKSFKNIYFKKYLSAFNENE